MDNKELIKSLNDKAKFIRNKTIELHCSAPETRIASSLSCVEILCVLYYGKILTFDAKKPFMDERDRFISSKAHGVICLYPILADLGFFPSSELDNICKEGTLLKAIPDMLIPGFETINGSLGHGLGVGTGIALFLKKKKRTEKTWVLLGDGELNEGSNWEAIMFIGHHKINNIVAIIDNNKGSMLDFCENIIHLEPFEEKLQSFGWLTKRVDGHNVEALCALFSEIKSTVQTSPIMIIADTIKGKGITFLETDPLSHIRNLTRESITNL